MTKNMFTPKFLFVAIMVVATCFIYPSDTLAQGMAINATGAVADTSAILDVAATNKGVLIPRMTQTQRDAIATPAIGLMIYQTDGTTGFYYYNGTAWTAVSATGNAVWGTQGNRGLSEYFHFLGTVDSTPLTFRVDSQFMGRLNAKTGNISFGLRAGQGLFPRPHSGNNIAIGRDALVGTTQVNNNIAIGDSASMFVSHSVPGGYGKETGNVAIGKSALSFNSGAGNVAIGYEALARGNTYALKIGNVAIGYKALQFSTTNANVAIGQFAMTNTINSAWNVAIGVTALQKNRTGNNNVAIGGGSMSGSDSTSENVAVGSNTLKGGYFADGARNTALGSNAMGNYYNCSDVICIGYNAGHSTNATNNSVYIGSSAGLNIEGGEGNIAIGRAALNQNYPSWGASIAGNNIAIGDSALSLNYMGEGNNIAIGKNTMVKFGDVFSGFNGGNGNVCLGVYALTNLEDGNNNTAIGTNTGGSGNLSNTTCIGYGATVSADNHIRIGNASVTQIGGEVGWSTLSDGRFKDNVKENVPGLEFVMKLRPVTYNFNAVRFEHFTNVADSLQKRNLKANIMATKRLRTGLIAQEVEKAAEACNYNFSGVHKPDNDKDHYSLSYEELTVPLIKAVQEQQKTIEQLTIENADLKNKMLELDKRLKALEK